MIKIINGKSYLCSTDLKIGDKFKIPNLGEWMDYWYEVVPTIEDVRKANQASLSEALLRKGYKIIKEIEDGRCETD